MTQSQIPTDDQKAAAMPWVMALFASWTAAVISYLCLVIYLSRFSANIWGIPFGWAAATWLIKRSAEEICIRQLQQIKGEKPRAWTDIAHNIFRLPMIASVIGLAVALVTILGCWLF